MDTTEKYIKMCQKVEEIQQSWECDDGDFMAAPPRTGVFNSDEKDKEWIIWTACDYYSAASYYQKEKKEDHPQAHQSYFNEYSDVFRQFDGGYEWDNELIAKRKDCIWLPRQDQLQEMIIENKLRNKYGYEMAWLSNLYEWATIYNEHYNDVVYTDYALKFKTLEQLWLAFVMSEKYNKMWNGKEWVKDEL